jgi:hypothetical protein
MIDPYLFALALGGAGLAGMTLVGLHGAASDGGGGHAQDAGIAGHHEVGSAGHAGDAGGGAAAGPHSGAPGTAGASHHHGAGHHDGTAPRWSVLLSPRVLFSALLGFGAAGLALRAFLAGPLLFAAAAAAGIAFEAFLVGPAWNLLLRFGSRPALTLEHGVMDQAEAVTAFNAEGDGLVKLVVDGQVVQLLGSLSAADLASGVRVRPGDTLVVETVDASRQRCTVSRRP